MALAASSEQISDWHKDYDNIDWDIVMMKDPKLRKAFGFQNSRPMSIRELHDKKPI